MDSALVTFLVLVIGTLIGAARMGERVFNLRQNARNTAARLLLDTWLVWCVFLALIVLFVAFLVFGNRLFPGISDHPYYRPVMVTIFGLITWGSLVALEWSWRRLTK